ncbi:MAG: hypothetical protein IPN53_02515 [Comamonadaceae bacterium]|nr:hypothetical protein [Comamonadaceae bacterium]
MHSAPAVTYPVGRSRLQGALVMVVVGMSALAMLIWIMQATALGARQLGTALLWLIASAWAFGKWWRTPEGCLAWDGTTWTWASAGKVKLITPEVTLDLQGAMLLRLHFSAHQGVGWVWPERRARCCLGWHFPRAVL